MLNVRLVTIAATIAIALPLALPVAAQTVPELEAQPISTQAVDEPASPAPQKLTVFGAIEKGRATLQAILDERLKTRPQPYAVSGNTTAHVTLAVWNRETDEFSIVEADKSGTKFTITSGPKLPITVSYSAQLESQYAMPPESHSLVVGVIYPVITEKKVPKKKSTFSATEVVYVPYNAEFYTPMMLSAGSDYLSFLIQDAFDELRAKGIKSRAFPDKLVADVVDPYLVKSIAVIEHSGTYSLTKPNDQDQAIGKFLLKLATNQEKAFGTSVSTAGAAGMVQFIPSTYAMLVRTRPDLGLIADFRTGMADHQNAVKAQIAYIDSDLADMATVRELYATDKAGAAAYLAASYNGGSVRVKRAYTTFGENWTKSFDELRAANKAKPVNSRLTLATLQSSTLRNETVGYVAKLKSAYGMFTAGYFATPAAPSGALPAQATIAAASASTSAPVTLAMGSTVICFGDGGCTAMQ